jgi:hypothetical protein
VLLAWELILGHRHGQLVTKLQIPTSNIQRNIKHQASLRVAAAEFGICSLGFVWMVDVGI